MVLSGSEPSDCKPNQEARELIHRQVSSSIACQTMFQAGLANTSPYIELLPVSWTVTSLYLLSTGIGVRRLGQGLETRATVLHCRSVFAS